MTDPLTTLLVDVEWRAVEIKQDRGGDYLQEAETGNGITLAELVKRYNSLLSAPAQPAHTDAGRAVVEAVLKHNGIPFAGVDRPSFGPFFCVWCGGQEPNHKDKCKYVAAVTALAEEKGE